MNETRYFLLILLTLIVGAMAAYMGYSVITSYGEIDFKINWNMFNSILIIPLSIIGFIVGLGQKFEVYTPVYKTKNFWGQTEYVKSNDLGDTVMAGCLLPLLQYLVVYPLTVAAMIYYPLMGLIYFFGVLFPYIIAAFFLVSLIFFNKTGCKLLSKSKGILWTTISALIFVSLFWVCFYLWEVDLHYKEPEIPFLSFIGSCVLIIIFSTIMFFVEKRVGRTDVPANDDTEAPATSGASGGLAGTFIIFTVIVTGVYCFKIFTTDNLYFDSPISITAPKVPAKQVENAVSVPAATVKKPATTNRSNTPQALPQKAEKPATTPQTKKENAVNNEPEQAVQQKPQTAEKKEIEEAMPI